MCVKYGCGGLNWQFFDKYVAMSQKRCRIGRRRRRHGTTMLQITNRKSYVVYRIAAVPMTFSDIEAIAMLL